MNKDTEAIVIMGIFVIIFAVIGIIGMMGPTEEQKSIKDYYAQETLVKMSPTEYLREIKNGNTSLLAVDLRSEAEYNTSHLVTSVNIPAGQMKSYLELIAAFDKLPKDKKIVVFCYSSYCMLSKTVGKTLSENGIFVQDFTAGWLEIKRDYNDYVVYGKEPGVLTVTSSGACSINDTAEFGC